MGPWRNVCPTPDWAFMNYGYAAATVDVDHATVAAV